jgi:hypothetical protein
MTTLDIILALGIAWFVLWCFALGWEKGSK